MPLDQELGTIAIAGCVFATLEWLENCSDPRIEVRADSPNPRTLKIEIVQRLAPFDEEAVHILREGVLPRTRHVTVPLALLAAKAVTMRYGGSIEVVAIGACGSVIRMTFCKSAEN